MIAQHLLADRAFTFLVGHPGIERGKDVDCPGYQNGSRERALMYSLSRELQGRLRHRDKFEKCTRHHLPPLAQLLRWSQFSTDFFICRIKRCQIPSTSQ
jgi:hypothetical protein